MNRTVFNQPTSSESGKIIVFQRPLFNQRFYIPLFSCQNGGIPTISRHTAQTENVRKCTPMSTFPVPSKVPELSTQQDMLTTALHIRHSVRASHERGGSVFLIITPVHAHRHVQRLRRHIRRNPRRNAPIRRNIRPRTLQTTPSLTIGAARRRTGSLML